jgi:hypothetical protein
LDVEKTTNNMSNTTKETPKWKKDPEFAAALNIVGVFFVITFWSKIFSQLLKIQKVAPAISDKILNATEIIFVFVVFAGVLTVRFGPSKITEFKWLRTNINLYILGCICGFIYLLLLGWQFLKFS